ARGVAGGGVGGRLGVGENGAVGGDNTRTEAGAAEVDSEERSYAFFSSSFRTAGDVVSPFCPSVTPFLNSLTLEPRERASSGSRLAPNSTSTMTRMISNS